jgi:hypothetical protein
VPDSISSTSTGRSGNPYDSNAANASDSGTQRLGEEQGTGAAAFREVAQQIPQTTNHETESFSTLGGAASETRSRRGSTHELERFNGQPVDPSIRQYENPFGTRSDQRPPNTLPQLVAGLTEEVRPRNSAMRTYVPPSPDLLERVNRPPPNTMPEAASERLEEAPERNWGPPPQYEPSPPSHEPSPPSHEPSRHETAARNPRTSEDGWRIALGILVSALGILAILTKWISHSN